MNKAILLSIKPKYVADILNGKKTLEIRKTFPNCELPIDVYIYCTKDKSFDLGCYKYEESCNGKVVAKFTLNKVSKFYYDDNDMLGYYTKIDDKGLPMKTIIERSCLSDIEFIDYMNFQNGYAWHIDNLQIFDKPKEISKFCVQKGFIEFTDIFTNKTTIEPNLKPLTKAPQSWCYIEV